MGKLTKSDKTFLALVLLMLLGKAVWTYLGVDHFIVQNWAGTWEAIIPAAVFGFIFKSRRLLPRQPKAGRWEMNA